MIYLLLINAANVLIEVTKEQFDALELHLAKTTDYKMVNAEYFAECHNLELKKEIKWFLTIKEQVVGMVIDEKKKGENITWL